MELWTSDNLKTAGINPILPSNEMSKEDVKSYLKQRLEEERVITGDHMKIENIIVKEKSGKFYVHQFNIITD